MNTISSLTTEMADLLNYQTTEMARISDKNQATGFLIYHLGHETIEIGKLFKNQKKRILYVDHFKLFGNRHVRTCQKKEN
jgi:hypothetical protein